MFSVFNKKHRHGAFYFYFPTQKRANIFDTISSVTFLPSICPRLDKASSMSVPEISTSTPSIIALYASFKYFDALQREAY